MTQAEAYFLSCKLYFKTWWLFRGGNIEQRKFELKRAKKDLELARALWIVERRKTHDSCL
jgi:hypothetical protein